MQIDKCTGRRGPDRPSLKSRWLDPSILCSHQQSPIIRYKSKCRDILTGPRRCIYLNINNAQRHSVWLYGDRPQFHAFLSEYYQCRNGAIILAYIGKILQLTTVVEFARLARYVFFGKINWGASG